MKWLEHALLYSFWSFIEHAKREREVIDFPTMIEINEKKGMKTISVWNSTAKGSDPAEEGLSILVGAPTNLQIVSLMDNITTNSWKGRMRSRSHDLITKSPNNGYHSPSSSTPFPQKLIPSHWNALGILTLGGFGILSHTLVQWFAIIQQLPVGSVVIVGCYALNRGDVGPPWALHRCEAVGTVNRLQEFRIFKGKQTWAFLRFQCTQESPEAIIKEGRFLGPILKCFDSVALGWDQESACFINTPGDSGAGTPQSELREMMPVVSAPPTPVADTLHHQLLIYPNLVPVEDTKAVEELTSYPRGTIN